MRLSIKGKEFICWVVVIVVLFCRVFKNNDNNIVNHEIVEASNYNLKIDYPDVKNKTVAKIMKEYIDTKKDEFVNTVKTLENEEFKYEFQATYSLSSSGKTESVHIIIYSFIGGNHYIREDKSYYYNVNTGEFLDLTYFLKDASSLEELSLLSYYYVNNYFDNNNIEKNEELIKAGTKSNLENYSHFIFKDNGLEILFVPYQIAPWSEGEIKITIPYSDLEDILKKEYLKESDTPKEIIANKRDLNPFKDKKLIALTFDDGPSNMTNKLLDNLDKYNARVTFFILGSRLNQYKDTLIRSYEMGNTIGSHTFSHLNLYKLSDYDIIKEVKNTNDLLKEITGHETSFLRPPYGNINKEIKELTNMSTILWDVDTEDWKYKNAEKVANNIIGHAHDGAIILLHDLYETSVDGALLAMERLTKEGYAFVTIEEMAELKNTTFDKTTSYFSLTN
ncbi:MAG: polysaccharide deacetylase family protein [Ruminococcus sp.]|nr:polysaccharide deacetylase family protein [Ruminococcus sp.]